MPPQLRPRTPSFSGFHASTLPIGTRMRGRDGNDYEVSLNVKTNKHIWIMFEQAKYNEIVISTIGNKKEVVYELAQKDKDETLKANPPLIITEFIPKDAESEEEVVEYKPRPRGRPAKPKKYTRAPSPYNLFVAEQMPKIKEQYPNLNGKERMKKCAELWQQQKDSIKS